MSYIGFTIIMAEFRIQSIINRRKILFPLLIIYIDNAFGGKQHGIAAVPCRHYAVKHIYAQGYALQYVPGRSYSHQVPGLFNGQTFAAKLADLVHHWFCLTYAKSPFAFPFSI